MGDLKKTDKYRELEQIYGKKKVYLKQRLLAKAMKIKRYDRRIAQYKINRLFQQDQKRVYHQLNGKVMKSLMLMKVSGFGVTSEWLRELPAGKMM